MMPKKKIVFELFVLIFLGSALKAFSNNYAFITPILVYIVFKFVDNKWKLLESIESHYKIMHYLDKDALAIYVNEHRGLPDSLGGPSMVRSTEIVELRKILAIRHLLNIGLLKAEIFPETIHFTYVLTAVQNSFKIRQIQE